jgi:CRP/FNR family transcriptional regulator, nitrogen oxide reductase regulator
MLRRMLARMVQAGEQGCTREPIMPERRARGRLPKLDPLPLDVARALYRIGTRESVPHGTYLYRQGEPADRLFAIEQGYAKITSESAERHQIVVAFLGPGYTIGVAGLHTPAIYNFNAVAADPLVVSTWTRAHAGQLINDPALRHYLDQLQHHYTEVLATRLHTLSEGPAVERVAAALLELSVMYGHKVGHGGVVEVDPPVTFDDLGALSGTRAETVSRFVTLWREHGAVLPASGRRLSLYPDRLRDVVFRSGPLLAGE